jgi:RNA polymerase sigma-70 factor (ECF subfamily)
MNGAELRRAYVSALSALDATSERVALPPDEQLEEELHAMCATALASMPQIADALVAFVAHLARHARDGALPSHEHAGDLALTFACARSVPSALQTLDPILTSNVARAVASIDRSSAFVDLVSQELRGRLLLGPSPKIGEYGGRGSLAGWLRTVATRTALNLRRGQAERPHDDLASELRDPAASPDVEILRAKYRGDFEHALRAALRRLPARERAVLCLNVRDGMSSDRIAALYRVGRSTVKRWLIAAREELAAGTKRELQSRLALSSAEYHSVAEGVRSAVDVSILRILAEDGGSIPSP